MKRLFCILTLLIVLVPAFWHTVSAGSVYEGELTNHLYLPAILMLGPQEPAVVVKSSNDFVPSPNYLYIVGEIANQTAGNARFINIQATLYNATDQVIYTSPTSVPMITILKPQMKSPFRVIINPIPAGYTRYELKVTWSETTTDVYVLEAQNVTTNWNNVFDAYHVVGTAHNQTAEIRSGVKAVVTLYDSGGRAVGVDKVTTSPSNLNAGASGTFDVELMFWDGKPDRSVITTYLLQIVDD